MTKVLWISRHQMTPFQEQDLIRAMKDEVCIKTYDKTIQDIEEIREEIRENDVIAVVLPIEKIMELYNIAGGKPIIQAVSARIATNQWIESEDGTKVQKYQFEHLYWQQIMECQIRTKRL